MTASLARRLVASLACVALVVGVAGRFQRVRNDLAAADAELRELAAVSATLQADLVRAIERNRQADAALAEARGTRSRRTLTRDDQAAGVDAVAAKVDEVGRTIDERRHTLAAQGERIERLEACLGGVAAALNQLAVGDTTGWEQSLAEVAPACDAVRAPT